MNLPANLIFKICGKSDLCNLKTDYTHVVSFTQPGEADVNLTRFFHAKIYRQKIHDAWSLYHKNQGMSIPDEKFTEGLIRDLLDIVEDVRDGKESIVLFHCHAGISRSTAAAFIFLSIILGESQLDRALGHVISVRSIAEPNIAFIILAERLLKFEDKMRRALKNRGRRWKTDLF